MFSRRNIRVKVMQTLYSLEAGEYGKIPGDAAAKVLDKNIEQSRQLFTYLVYCITEIARYAEVDAQQRSSKHLPTRSDLEVNTKIANNGIVLSILQDASFRNAVKNYNLASITDGELIKKSYHSLVSSAEYGSYISAPEGVKSAEKKILQFIFSDIILLSSDFISHLEENFIHWEDDGDMMILLMNAFFQKPGAFNFDEILSDEKRVFGRELLESVNDKKDYCLELIRPKLKNWDMERVAALDMILMQMGVCEFLYFDTIPPKVTINEYIDLAKEYSTPQSGHFINGILDNIHKELLAANRIHKKNYKNSTF